jgi:hypothetical protein
MICRKLSLPSAAVASLLAISLLAPSISHAQQSIGSNDLAASSPASQSTKAQRKAERKANRAKKNAELSQLEKSGYNPAGDTIHYPQNIQDAERKVNPQQ